MPPRPTNNPQPLSSISSCAPRGQSTDSESIVDTRTPKPAHTPDAGSLTPEQSARSRRVISNIRKILLTTPAFPRLYADVVLTYSPNSREAKILRPHYQKICEKVNAIMSQNGTCTHIKVTGVRCGSPALKGEQFCYFHQNAHRSVRRPKQSRLHPIAMIEDEESIQYALMEVMNALMKNTIDLKRATLILRALHIAVKNASRVKFATQGKNSITQVPDFAPPPDNADFNDTHEIDLPYNAWVPPKTERQIMEENARAQKLEDWKAQQAQIRANLERASITRHHRNLATAAPGKVDVGTAAPGGPGREATLAGDDSSAPRPEQIQGRVPAPEAGKTATPQSSPRPITPHNFKPQQSTPIPQQSAIQGAGTERKPPKPATPDDRKNTTPVRPNRIRGTARHA